MVDRVDLRCVVRNIQFEVDDVLFLLEYVLVLQLGDS